ncbi:DUF6308 family protein [Streptomyces sp. NBC_00076]|uniref:DUF6308 family protein n=1 Tax=Streptomyces sp. NBC_00076 TaxID=2975642 RepID=UPI0032533731
MDEEATHIAGHVGRRGLGDTIQFGGRQAPCRKRPRLLPVYDQVVRCVLGRPKSFWLDALRADNHALHRELMALRQSADLPATGSALRVCDVVLWMHHRTDHHREAASGPEVCRSHPGESSAGGHMALCPWETPRDLRCTKVPTISLISYRQLLNLVGISAGHERCLVPTSDPGHTTVVPLVPKRFMDQLFESGTSCSRRARRNAPPPMRRGSCPRRT